MSRHAAPLRPASPRRRAPGWLTLVLLLVLLLAGPVHAAPQNPGFELPPVPSYGWTSTGGSAIQVGAVCSAPPPEGSAQAMLGTHAAGEVAALESAMLLWPGTLAALGSADVAAGLWQTFPASAGDVVVFEFDFLHDTLFSSDFLFVSLSDGASARYASRLSPGGLATCGEPYVYRHGHQSAAVTIPHDGNWTLGFGAVKANRNASDVALLVDAILYQPAAPPVPDLVLAGEGFARTVDVGGGLLVQLEEGSGATLSGGVPGGVVIPLLADETALLGLPAGSPQSIPLAPGDWISVPTGASVGEPLVLRQLHAQDGAFSDADGDGVLDRRDNCLGVANPGQLDADGDGYGGHCDADLDNDGVVGAADFGAFAQRWGSADPFADFDGSGNVGAPDFAVIAGSYGGAPGPSGLACAGSIPCGAGPAPVANLFADGSLSQPFAAVADGHASGERAAQLWHWRNSPYPFQLEVVRVGRDQRQRVELASQPGSYADGVGQHLFGALQPGTPYQVSARVRVFQGQVRLGVGPLYAGNAVEVHSSGTDGWETLSAVYTPGASDATVQAYGIQPGTIFEIDDFAVTPLSSELVLGGEGTLRTTPLGGGLMVELEGDGYAVLTGGLVAGDPIELLPGDVAILGLQTGPEIFFEITPDLPVSLGEGLPDDPALTWSDTLAAFCPGRASCERLDPPKALREDFLLLPKGVAPLFALGDLDEDGAVNAADLTLLEGLVASQQYASVSCAAAGDLDGDGEIGAGDAAALAEMLVDGPLSAPALSAQPHMPCEYENAVVAATLESRGSAPIELHLLAGRTTDDVGIELLTPDVGLALLPDAEGWMLDPSGVAPGTLVLASVDDVEVGELLFGIRIGDDAGDEPGAGDSVATGEEPEHVDCPQRRDGCEALIIDFAHHTTYEADSRDTRNALMRGGCNVEYVTPYLVRVPQPIRYRTLIGQLRTYTPPASAVQRANDNNDLQWALIQESVARHRAALRAGREIAIQLVNGHGSDGLHPNGDNCGTWGPSFDFGHHFWRQFFHSGNYAAALGNTCSNVAEDLSCYSGRTPQVIEELNNLGTATCQADPAIDHSRHAGHDQDVALSLAPSTDTCSNGSVWVRDGSLAGMIQRKTRYSRDTHDYGDLSDAFLQEAVMDDPPSSWKLPGHYSDRGRAECTDDGHSASY